VRQIDRLGAVPRAGPASRAGDARDGLAGRSYASAVGIAVCDDEHLLGLVPRELLLAARADVELAVLMEPVATVGTRSTRSSPSPSWRAVAAEASPSWTGRAGFAGSCRRNGPSPSFGESTGRIWLASAGFSPARRGRAHRGRGAGWVAGSGIGCLARARVHRGDGIGGDRRLVRGRTCPAGAARGLRPRGRLHGGRGRDSDRGRRGA
jgi:hypothetical protein